MLEERGTRMIQLQITCCRLCHQCGLQRQASVRRPSCHFVAYVFSGLAQKWLRNSAPRRSVPGLESYHDQGLRNGGPVYEIISLVRKILTNQLPSLHPLE